MKLVINLLPYQDLDAYKDNFTFIRRRPRFGIYVNTRITNIIWNYVSRYKIYHLNVQFKNNRIILTNLNENTVCVIQLKYDNTLYINDKMNLELDIRSRERLKGYIIEGYNSYILNKVKPYYFKKYDERIKFKHEFQSIFEQREKNVQY